VASLVALLMPESSANSSSMNDSLKYLRRLFCRESYHNTNDTAVTDRSTNITTTTAAITVLRLSGLCPGLPG